MGTVSYKETRGKLTKDEFLAEYAENKDKYKYEDEYDFGRDWFSLSPREVDKIIGVSDYSQIREIYRDALSLCKAITRGVINCKSSVKNKMKLHLRIGKCSYCGSKKYKLRGGMQLGTAMCVHKNCGGDIIYE